MSKQNIIFKQATATAVEIEAHLVACDEYFIPRLSQKTDIPAYAKKIAEKSCTFEAWEDLVLVGLVAAYMNDEAKKTAFITSVSTLISKTGRGIAGKLIANAAVHAQKLGFAQISLEVSPQNLSAMKLYTNSGYEKTGMTGEMAVMKKQLSDQ